MTARSVVDQHQITDMTGTGPPPPPPYEKSQAASLPPVAITSAMFPSPSFGREPVATMCRNCHSNVETIQNIYKPASARLILLSKSLDWEGA